MMINNTFIRWEATLYFYYLYRAITKEKYNNKEEIECKIYKKTYSKIKEV